MALAQSTANPLPADGLAPVRESRAAVLASGERITVLGRWVVLAAAVILNHFGNRNAQDSLFTVDLILCFWALVNAGVSFLLLRGFRPGRWFGFLTTAVDLGVATSVLYYAGGYGAPTDFSLLFYLLIVASAVRLGLPGALSTAAVVSILYIVIGGITRFATASPPAGFVMGRVFLFVFTALVAGLLVGDLKARLDLAVQAAVDRARQLEETKRRQRPSSARRRGSMQRPERCWPWASIAAPPAFPCWSRTSPPSTGSRLVSSHITSRNWTWPS